MTDYEVGYKKPPRHSQFKKGNCCNPKGRGKRKIPKESEIIRALLNFPLEFREGGESKRASRIEILIKRLGAAALKGDPSAAAMLLKMRESFEKDADINPVVVVIDEIDDRL